MSLADNIKRLREKKHFSQTELGKEVGVSQQAILGFEKGKIKPDVYTAVALAKKLDTTVEELVRG